VYPLLSGTLERIYVRDGQTVEQGQLLAQLRNRELAGQIEDVRTQHAIRVTQLKSWRLELADSRDGAERSRLEIAMAKAEGERHALAGQLEVLEKKLRFQEIRAPRGGVVMRLPRLDEVGKLWEKDQTAPFCMIGDPSRLRLLVPLSAADHRLVQEDFRTGRELAVTVRIHGWGGRTWPGRIAALPESETRDLPPALSTRGGGPVPLKAGPGGPTAAPQSQRYLVSVDLLQAEHDGIWPGCLGQVKIHCRWRSASWWLWHKISTAFDLGLTG
jgi:multidrug efflux pump subunit AcrA (membrane-fusion protein)